jgi:alpha-tubulin suppressor-like RCC1 family protein
VSEPELVALPSPADAIFAGGDHTCALLGQTAYCWGANDRGQLGVGTTDDSAYPKTPIGLGPVSSLSLGPRHTCAIDAASSLRCWGDNGSWQLDNELAGFVTLQSSAASLSGVKVSRVVTGDGFTCSAAASGAKQYCAGDNKQGQLAVVGPSFSMSSKPTPLAGPIALMTAGNTHACRKSEHGPVECWGGNQLGQLGSGSALLKGQPGNVAW